RPSVTCRHSSRRRTGHGVWSSFCLPDSRAPMGQTSRDSDIHGLSRATAARVVLGRIGARVARGSDIGRADSGFGEGEFDSVGGSLIPGQGGNDGPNLLVTGEHEECGGATIRLHPGDIEVLLRMGQQVGSMWWNGSTAVILRVDEWSQLRWC